MFVKVDFSDDDYIRVWTAQFMCRSNHIWFFCEIVQSVCVCVCIFEFTPIGFLFEICFRFIKMIIGSPVILPKLFLKMGSVLYNLVVKIGIVIWTMSVTILLDRSVVRNLTCMRLIFFRLYSTIYWSSSFPFCSHKEVWLHRDILFFIFLEFNDDKVCVETLEIVCEMKI